MSSEKQGRESPDPERQTAGQSGAPAGGQGINKDSKNQEESNAQLDELSSNPPDKFADLAKEKTKKTVGDHAGE